MSLLKKLFGGGGRKPAAVVIEYKGFRISPDPMPADGQFRICAVIEGEVDGETKTHRLIRADLLRDLGQARDASVEEAKVMIDQQGDRMFSA